MSTFGKLLGLADATEQAELLNEAGRTLRRMAQVEDAHADMQFCRIVDKLDADGRWWCERLASLIESDKEPRR